MEDENAPCEYVIVCGNHWQRKQKGVAGSVGALTCARMVSAIG
jgi:hypothetical protein